MYKVFLRLEKRLKRSYSINDFFVCFTTETSHQWPPTHPKSAGKEYFYVNYLPIFISLEAAADCLSSY